MTKSTSYTVRALFSDVDGVLTDGNLYIGLDGAEAIKVFHVRDGMAIKRLQRCGILFGIISGRDSQPLRKRMAELGVSEVHTRIHDKATILKEILERKNIPPAAVWYVGDDCNDLPVQEFLKREGGRFFCPADAALEVIEAADETLEAPGGKGVLAELVRRILSSGSP
jgi:3-deoxy-D-manno-octulosonate 8-phosphate phosphatase (KDO 8-P phosphatase)